MCQLEAAASSLRRVGVLMAAIAVAFIALGLGLGLAVSASGVLASHDDPDTIHACVNPLSRVARIVEDPARCAYYDELVEWQGAGGTADLEARISALEQENASQQETIDGLVTQVSTLTTQVGDLAAWQATLACIQTAAGLNPDVADIVFTACNVHVRSGSGTTDGAINGLGNLIVGYNEVGPFGENRAGSHNLVVGPEHSYTSYGGLVAGSNNTVSGESASVSGGELNTASGRSSSVSGGELNTASGRSSSVSSGASNTASGRSSSVVGGAVNEASGDLSRVSGGVRNTASGQQSSVSGGQFNTASGSNSSISGGSDNEASGGASSVVGGTQDVASGDFDTVIGDSDGTPAFDAATGSLIYADQ